MGRPVEHRYKWVNSNRTVPIKTQFNTTHPPSKAAMTFALRLRSPKAGVSNEPGADFKLDMLTFNSCTVCFAVHRVTSLDNSHVWPTSTTSSLTLDAQFLRHLKRLRRRENSHHYVIITQLFLNHSIQRMPTLR